MAHSLVHDKTVVNKIKTYQKYGHLSKNEFTIFFLLVNQAFDRMGKENPADAFQKHKPTNNGNNEPLVECPDRVVYNE